MVAALIVSKPASTSGARSRWPCRSIAETRIGTNGRSRLPQIRSDASQTTINASRVAWSYIRRSGRRLERPLDTPARRRRIACLR